MIVRMPNTALSSIAASLLIFSATASHAEENTFDTNLLKKRGLDPALSQYFSGSTKLLPGKHEITLLINGNNKGKVSLNFGKNGQLCVDDVFFNVAGLKDEYQIESRDDKDIITSQEQICDDYKQILPDANINVLTDKNEVDILISTSALNSESEIMAFQNAPPGETASLLNYALLSSHSESADYKNDYNQADIEVGANSDNWLFRSHHLLGDDNGVVSNSVINSYIQHTFIGLGTTFQAGLINMNSPIFSTGNIFGFQFTPEESLKSSEAKSTPVSGIARTNQARVEVRQAGQLIYSTLVSAGPFTLNSIPLVHSNSDLIVTVKETDNRQSTFTVSQQLFNKVNVSETEGFQIAAGFWDEDDDTESKPEVLTLSDGFLPVNWMSVTSAAMLAKQYVASGEKFSLHPFGKLGLSETIKISDDVKNKHKGVIFVSQADLSLPGGGGVTLASTHYSKGYRELEDTFQDDFTSNISEYSASLNWQHEYLGAFTTTYTISKSYDGSNNQHSIYLTWGKNFRGWSISVNWQRQLDKNNRKSSYQDYTDDDPFFININVPLGEHSFSTYYRKQGDSSESGLQTNGKISDDDNYTLSAGHNYLENDNSVNGTLNTNLHYAQMNLSLGKNGKSSKNYGAMLGGSIALHHNNFLFSPYAVKDTFSIVDVNSHTAGVEFFTPNGNVWTDRWGRAVIPSLSPYHTEKIEINSNSLPAGTSISDAIPSVTLGRGAVGETMLHLTKTNNVIIETRMGNGDKVPKGSTIVDEKGNYTATVVDDGVIFLENTYSKSYLYLQGRSGERVCKIIFTLPERDEYSQNYLKTNGVCKK
jgi:outer membrane usher protein FimD/PapC